MAHCRILLVEDYSDFGRALALLLRRDGHECRTCQDAPAALAILDEYRPHAVILDVRLPGLSGLDLARQIRARPDGERMALIGCSGFAFPTDRERGLEAGMDVYFTKPVAAGELVQAVETLVAKRGLCETTSTTGPSAN